MNKKPFDADMSLTLKSNILLLITAIIWGSAFVAQRIGGEYVGAFTFNGLRFFLGFLSLIPVILYFENKKKRAFLSLKTVYAGLIAGLCLFIAASLQQIGINETTAGKAAFITGLYIVLVPLFGILLKHSSSRYVWFGALIAIIGLYLLTVTERFTIGKGDILECIGAVFWAFHILLIDYFVKKNSALKLSAVQFITCSILSLSAAMFFEQIQITNLVHAMIPIAYGGICSVGIAYTLQVVAQKNAKPSHAAIILSMETVFAAIGGFIILGETLSFRSIVGCLLMLAGMLVSQIQKSEKRA
jgi:drug/metabolite transporter (DMT)-like permease